MEVQVRLAEDRKTLDLTLPEECTLTAQELEDLIRYLGMLRANMMPSVPEDQTLPTTIHSIVPAVSWHVTLDQDAPTQVRLFLRHLGFGWLWIPLAEANIDQMCATLHSISRQKPKLQ